MAKGWGSLHEGDSFCWLELGSKTNTKPIEEWKHKSLYKAKGPFLIAQSYLISNRPVVTTGEDEWHCHGLMRLCALVFLGVPRARVKLGRSIV